MEGRTIGWVLPIDDTTASTSRAASPKGQYRLDALEMNGKFWWNSPRGTPAPGDYEAQTAVVRSPSIPRNTCHQRQGVALLRRRAATQTSRRRRGPGRRRVRRNKACVRFEAKLLSESRTNRSAAGVVKEDLTPPRRLRQPCDCFAPSTASALKIIPDPCLCACMRKGRDEARRDNRKAGATARTSRQLPARHSRHVVVGHHHVESTGRR